MAYNRALKIAATIVFLIFSINSCSPSSKSGGSKNSEIAEEPDKGKGSNTPTPPTNNTPTPPTNNTPPPPPPSGLLLFQTNQSPAELSALKTAFVQNTPVVAASGSYIPYYSINTVRSVEYYQPKSPVVHPYHSYTVRAPLVLALPEYFRWNIPLDIRAQITQYDIDTLDIWFTPQDEIRDPTASLKPTHWMFPNRPRINDINGSPPEYQKTVLLGLFDSDHPIDDQVVSGHLRSFQVSLHDQRVSPDTGHINIAAAPDESFSFYSLAIFEEQRRAAVTLHWMLTVHDRDELQMMAAGTLRDLMVALNAPGSVFLGKPMLTKLNELVGYNP